MVKGTTYLHLVIEIAQGILASIELAEANVTQWSKYEEVGNIDALPVLIDLLTERLETAKQVFIASVAGQRLVASLEIAQLLYQDWAMTQEFFITGIDNATQEDCAAHLRYMLEQAHKL